MSTILDVLHAANLHLYLHGLCLEIDSLHLSFVKRLYSFRTANAHFRIWSSYYVVEVTKNAKVYQVSSLGSVSMHEGVKLSLVNFNFLIQFPHSRLGTPPPPQIIIYH
jgi:hypothetical protein